MTTGLADARDRLGAVLADARGSWSTGESDWLTRLREAGVAQFENEGFPTSRNEEWRYTSLDFLMRHQFEAATKDSLEAVRHADLEPFVLPETDAARLVFINGRYAAHLSDPGPERQGVVIGGLGDWLARDPEAVKAHLGSAGDSGDVFAALNAALMSDGAYVKLERGMMVERPIELLHISTAAKEPKISHPHALVVLEEGAQATLIERHVTLGEGVCFNNAVVEIALARDSVLRHQRLQEEGPASYHLTALQVMQQEASRYLHCTAALGGAWSRTGITLTFAGAHAVAELDGLYLAGEGQLNDVHLDIRHQVPDCQSRETFKGILDGRGRAVFDGRVLVAKDAQRTDARLSNDNLMLSRNAEVDTKPQLEIYADDVRCSHGTTVGQLDDDMLFYLRSRGIDGGEARRILCLGFAGEILERFDTEGLHQRAQRLLSERLATTDGKAQPEAA